MLTEPRTSTLVSKAQRWFYGTISVLALWVGIWGFFVPDQVDRAIPWFVPPLHARFIGALYLSVFVTLAWITVARHWFEVRIMMIPIAIWTGGLLIVSMFYLDEFDFGAPRVWVWFGAYIAYPILGIGTWWRHRDDRSVPDDAPELASVLRSAYLVMGIVIIAVAVALLVITDRMVEHWPWKIDPMLAHVYAAPLLSYGLVSVLIARARSWSEGRITALSLGLFGLLALVASIIHRALFDAGEIADWLWFIALGFMTVLGIVAAGQGVTSRRERGA